MTEPNPLPTAAAAAPTSRVRELTLRGLILGALITFVFTAANTYLGLKVGLTFATSIPAAVISMAVLSFFKGSSVLENNIVQTVASAAGALASIIFVLPGMVIVGWWTGFPFWTSFLICASGGIIGVLFTIPLRRAMVTHSDLPYPEGVAAAEVLKVGSGVRGEIAATAGTDARSGLRAIVWGAVASAAFALFSATRVAAGAVQGFFRLGRSVSGIDVGLSLALVGAGHLVGLSVGIALLVGVVIAWGIAVPILSANTVMPAGMSVPDFANQVWSTQVRFIGAGAIAVSALWTLAKLARPVAAGLAHTLAAARRRENVGSAERDLSPVTIGGLLLGCLLAITGLVVRFVQGTALQSQTIGLVAITLGFVLVGGFLVSAICGYLAGLVGSTNSPISGVGILAILVYASLLGALMTASEGDAKKALIAFALFTLSIVFSAATTSNDNLQDLKTGQLVGAAPWAQQVALVVGILAGAAIIPPVLDLLARAYGFAGQVSGPVSPTVTPLPAPQAVLISALAQGVLASKLNVSMLLVGAGVGAAVIALDEFLRWRGWMRLPPLGVCIGIYLPMSASTPVVIGAVLSEWFARRARRSADPKAAEQKGVLVASGLIVGESLFGVALAGIIVATGKEAPLALVAADFPWAMGIGAVVFVALVAALYRWMLADTSRA
ncbi:MAG: oligopeptide transporter, OPT family [Myxococcaceae bacterium]|nr:oligopeptide transporter, OPT family [Myxococcaceae bacterium]